MQPHVAHVARRRIREVAPLLLLVLVSLLLLGFWALARTVAGGGTFGPDRALLLALRVPGDLTDPLGPRWFEEGMRDVTALGGHVVLGLLTLASSAYLLMIRRHRAAAYLLAAVLGGMLLSAGLKELVARPRPDLVPHGQAVYTASFPSGHAMLSAVTYLTLGALLARASPSRRTRAFLMGLAVALTLAVGLSRVYLGVHWPSDVLAGWCGGGAWAALCWLVEARLQDRGQVERPDEATPP